MQIKSTKINHLTLIRIVNIKKGQKITNIGANVEKLESFSIAGGNIKCCSCYEKQLGGSSNR